MMELQVVSESDSGDTPRDFTSQISETLNSGELPSDSGSFSVVYRRTIKSGEGTMEVAVKTFKIDPWRAMDKLDKGIRRELRVWLKLKHPTIVPLLGIANVLNSRFPALVSLWMSSGTLYMYLEQQGTITASAKVELVRGVIDGLEYLHSENVVHGDLHPGNVLIDGLGHPRLTDFGLATVAGDIESQLNTTTAARNFNPQWRAPEVVGIDSDPVRPNFKSDVYSFGSVMSYIVSSVVPWKEKNSTQIIIELSKKATPARPDNILDDHWNLIQQCWSWDPVDRPEPSEVIRIIATTNTTTFGESRMTKNSLQAGWHAAKIPPDDTIQTLGPSDRSVPTPAKSQASRSVIIIGQYEKVKNSLIRVLSQPKAGPSSTPAKVTSPRFRGLLYDFQNRKPRNVVIIGPIGAGKSSLINILCPEARIPVSDATTGCTKEIQKYRCNLGQQQYCQVHDTIGLEEGHSPNWGFLRDTQTQKQLRSLAKMIKKSELHLLVYCIPGTGGNKSQTRNFTKFKDVAALGNVPVVVVVTHLENFYGPLENWWSEYATTLEDLGIPESTKHACVTTLPKDKLNRSRYLYDQSWEVVKSLIRRNLPRNR